MRSVADLLREEDTARLAALSPAARLHLALRLGRRDLAVFAAASGLDLETARARLRANRHTGRQPCTVFSGESEPAA
jgi:hypothetical protein